jgi:hypothetical protein
MLPDGCDSSARYRVVFESPEGEAVYCARHSRIAVERYENAVRRVPLRDSENGAALSEGSD